MPSEQTLLLATDSSALYVYDVRVPTVSPTVRPSQTYHPHDDYVTSISALQHTGDVGMKLQWLSTGGTTVAVTDLRRGILVQSEDQQEELLSSAVLENQKVIVGGSKGTLRVWQAGVWDDNETTVDMDERRSKASVETLVPIPGSNVVAAGMDDGFVRFMYMLGDKGQLLNGSSVRHDDLEAVTSLGFVDGGRMISGGGTNLMIWEDKHNDPRGYNSDPLFSGATTQSGLLDSDGDREPAEDRNSSDDEDSSRKKKKRRKNNKGKASSNNGLIGFKDLD